MSINKVIIIGRLGKDPEVRSAGNATLANFSIATTESWKDKSTGEKKQVTEWHNIVVWKQLAEIASKYLHKGDQVYIEGKLKTRSWEKDGITRYATEIIGDTLTMLSKSPTQATQSTTSTPVVESNGSTDDYNFNT